MTDQSWRTLKAALETALNAPDCPINKAAAGDYMGFKHRQQIYAYLGNSAHAVPSYDLGQKFKVLLDWIDYQRDIQDIARDMPRP